MDLKLRTYLEIKEIDPEHFDTNIDYKIEVVAIYENKSASEVGDYNLAKINSIYDYIKITPKPSVNELILNNVKLKKIPFENLTLGEWIDLEYYISKPDTILEIMAIIFRKFEPETDFEPIKFEPYGDWLNHRTNLFLEVQVEDVWNLRVEYLKFRENILNQYSGLFTSELEDETDELTTEELEEYNRIKELEQKQQAFNWELIIMELVNGDITKFEDVLKMPLILVFNVLSSIKIKADKLRK